MTLDGTGGCNDPDWKGGEIYINVNNIRMQTIPRGFEGTFPFCIVSDKFNVAQAIIQLESSDIDGVCITSLQINNEILLLGKSKSKSEFWIDGNKNECSYNRNGASEISVVAAPEISIRNGNVYSSPCKGWNSIFCKFENDNSFLLR